MDLKSLINLSRIEEILGSLNSFFWGPVVLSLYFLTGLLLSVKIRFFQFVHPIRWLRQTIGQAFRGSRKSSRAGALSQYQTFNTVLASCIGTGNIVGVATAIFSGGPGAVFWLWNAALFSMASAFAENVLGVRYRTRNTRGEFVGGPMHYIRRGLNAPKTARLYAALCTLASFGIGCMTQSNSIALAVEELSHIPPHVSGLALTALSALCIFGGVKRIAAVCEKLVPAMSAFYILGGLALIALNAPKLPAVFASVFQGAFSMKAAAGGGAGFAMAKAIRYGTARGVFSNEAGLGTSAIVNAASDVSDPVDAGMWGFAQVFVDTIVLCTISAVLLLMAPVGIAGETGVAMVHSLFSSLAPGAGAFALVAVVLFAFTTIVGWSYHGSVAFAYLFGEKRLAVYKAMYALAVFAGCVFPVTLVWEACDLFNALMALPNLAALLFLSGEVGTCFLSWRQRQRGH